MLKYIQQTRKITLLLLVIFCTSNLMPTPNETLATAGIHGSGAIAATISSYLTYRSLDKTSGWLNQLCQRIPGLKKLYKNDEKTLSLKQQRLKSAINLGSASMIGIATWYCTYRILKSTPTTKPFPENTIHSYQIPRTATNSEGEAIIDPGNAHQIVGNWEKRQGECKKIEVKYEMYMPDQNGSEKIPAVVLCHDSAGINPANRAHAKWLVKQGVACMILDHFGHLNGTKGRGVQRLIRNQWKMSMEDGVIDAYNGRKELCTRFKEIIDPNRIGITGFSRGAEYATLAQRRHMHEALSHDGKPFDMAYCHYPALISQPINIKNEVANKPYRVLMGESDNYTPIAPVRNYVNRLRNAGKDAKLYAYPNTYHSFDSHWMKANQRHLIPAMVAGNAYYAYDKEGFIPVPSGIVEQENVVKRRRIPYSDLRAHCQRHCRIEDGAVLAHNPDALKQSRQDISSFLKHCGFVGNK